jgi:arylsulfatase A-like enzyme
MGNITQAIKEKGMWEDTLVIMSTDNGGPTYWIDKKTMDSYPPLIPGDPRSKPGYAHGGGANNWPLRGSKVRINHCMLYVHWLIPAMLYVH